MMPQLENSPTFQQLLESCSDQASPNWERGWREFIKRYKMFIYKKVTRRCSEYRVPRLRRQLSEAVNDIVAKVYFQLYKSQCQALRDFCARDNERRFLAWLATICSRTTSRYIQDYFTMTLVDEEPEEVRDYLTALNFDARWELYEALVEKLRAIARKKRRYLERDIHIFLQYVWADFPAAMMASHPCLKNIGPRVVDNIVNRMRTYLRREENF
jgi:hypothetical protein